MIATSTPARVGALPPSPPTSIPRSSNEEKGQYPPQESSNGVRRPPPPQAFEDQLQQHHRILKGFLAPTIAAQGQAAKAPSRARDKLLRLSPVQFQELSTDVYDELLRRQDQQRTGGAHGWTVPNFLLPKPNYHPKRNQARQKLSSLAGQKFNELAMDVYYELERRFPKLATMDYSRVMSPVGHAGPNGMRGPNPNFSPRPNPPPPINAQAGPRMRSPSSSSPQPYSPSVFDNRSQPSSSPIDYDGRHAPRPFHGLAQKSSMVNINESAIDDRGDDTFDANSPVPRPRRRSTKSNVSPMQLEHINTAQKAHLADLEKKIHDLESQIRQKNQEIQRGHAVVTEKDQTFELERAKAATLASDLEKQVQSAANLNSSLESELDKLRVSNLEMQNEVLSKARSSTTENNADQWRLHYETLKKDYEEQKRLTEHVRQEAFQSLQEMITLSKRSNQAAEVEESHLKQIADLESSVSHWKDRYTKAKAQTTRLSSNNPLIPQRALHHASFVDYAGLVQDASVQNFNAAIDELLRLSRAADPADVLEYMRTIVSCVRALTEDIDMGTASSPDAAALRQPKLRARVTAAANNLITAAKTFSQSKGLSPVSLLDAATGSLVAAVVELVQTVRIRTAAPMLLSDEPPTDDGDIDFS